MIRQIWSQTIRIGLGGKTRQPKWQMAGIWKSVVRGSHLPEWLWVRRGMWPWKSTLKSTVLIVNVPQKRRRIFNVGFFNLLVCVLENIFNFTEKVNVHYVCLLNVHSSKNRPCQPYTPPTSKQNLVTKNIYLIERNSYEAQNNFLLYLMFVFLAIILHKTEQNADVIHEQRWTKDCARSSTSTGLDIFLAGRHNDSPYWLNIILPMEPRYFLRKPKKCIVLLPFSPSAK